MPEASREERPFADIIDAFERVAADAAAIGAPAPTLTEPGAGPATVAVPAPHFRNEPGMGYRFEPGG